MVHRLATAGRVLGSRGMGEDRIEVIRLPDCILIAVADGAGGMGGGAVAAEAVISGLRAAARGLASGLIDPGTLLSELDDEICAGGGQSTAVIAVLRNEEISGASVG